MKVMILAAGGGTRLRPLTLDRPKPMLPVADRPLLEHILTWLKSHGITQVAINLHYRPEAVQTYFGDGAGFGVEICYSVEDPILGTAGAVRKLRHYFDSTFVVVYGDVLTTLDLSALVRFHRQRGGGAPAWLTLSLYRVPNPTECGLVELDGAGRVTRFVEKPPPEEVFTDLASAGVLVLEPAIVDFIPANTYFDFGHDLFPLLIARDAPMYGFPMADDEYLIDIGTPEKYRRVQREWPGK